LTYKGLIEANPAVMLGKPVIAGTRITVELILEKLASGENIDQIMEEYPHVTREGMQAAYQFALESLKMLSTLLGRSYKINLASLFQGTPKSPSVVLRLIIPGSIRLRKTRSSPANLNIVN